LLAARYHARMTTLERERQLQREREAWTSPWYPAVFALAFAAEWALWHDALYPSLGAMALLALTVVLASVPWVGSWQHRAESEALRRSSRRGWFVIPALVAHLALGVYYGPDWQGGASSAGIRLTDTLHALMSRERMADLAVRAAAHPDVRDLRFLLRWGADPNRADAQGNEPIYVARTASALALLREHVRRVEPARAAAALSYFADQGDVDATRTLLELGADPSLAAADAQGNTPLHLAAFSEHIDVIALLLQAGARRDARNDLGDTPLDYARRWHRAEAERALR
jgi:hypothetical protein